MLSYVGIMDNTVSEMRQKMAKVLEVIRGDLATVRTGRATPALVENIAVSVYGGAQRLRIMELATIGASESNVLTLTPFDNSILDEIQKGILAANVGLTPSTDGHVIRIIIPSLSEERRQELTKLVGQKLENGRIMLRQVRHEAMDSVKKQFSDKLVSKDELMRLEKDIQKVTDDIMGQIELLRENKEAELMQI